MAADTLTHGQETEVEAAGAKEDDEGMAYEEDDGTAWYAAAAAEPGDEDAGEEGEVAMFDPYLMAADPDKTEVPPQPVPAATAEGAPEAPPQAPASPAPASGAQRSPEAVHASAQAEATAVPEQSAEQPLAEGSAPLEAGEAVVDLTDEPNPTKKRRGTALSRQTKKVGKKAPEASSQSLAAAKLAASKTADALLSGSTLSEVGVAPSVQTHPQQETAGYFQAAEATATAEEEDYAAQVEAAARAAAQESVPAYVQYGREETDDPGMKSWDERVVVVRQGQVHIELQHRNPPMRDETLLRFCDWLDQQMPLVVGTFPYVRKSGAYVDLSDNAIGPEGLDKLFRVLRDHRVPCVVMKCYRNLLDDSIVDTLIEYLYTQPEAFPMHGIHISHNIISDKGAFRLIKAAAMCGHYPRLSTRLPLWLRLEANDIKNPEKIIAECLHENFHVCLMGNGLCSRRDCNHYSGVHVQLPYFLNQGVSGLAAAVSSANQVKQETGLPQPLDPNWSGQVLQPPPPPAPYSYPGNYQSGGSWGSSSYPGDSGGYFPGTSAKAAPYKGKGGGKAYKGWQKGGSAAPAALGSGYGKGRGKGGHWNDMPRRPMWVGPSLPSKAKKDVRIPESEHQLGFQWRFREEGIPPIVVQVTPGSVASQVARVGDCLLRVNSLDLSMFSEKQINDMLKQRPLDLRFGDL